MSDLLERLLAREDRSEAGSGGATGAVVDGWGPTVPVGDAGGVAGLMRLGADAPVRVLAGVLLFVTLLAGAASGVSGTLSISGFNALGTESARADDLVRSRFGGADPGLVLRAEAEGAVDGPRARAAGV